MLIFGVFFEPLKLFRNELHRTNKIEITSKPLVRRFVPVIEENQKMTSANNNSEMLQKKVSCPRKVVRIRKKKRKKKK